MMSSYAVFDFIELLDGRHVHFAVIVQALANTLDVFVELVGVEVLAVDALKDSVLRRLAPV